MKLLITIKIILLLIKASSSFIWKDCGDGKNNSVHFLDVKAVPDQVSLSSPLKIGGRWQVDSPIPFESIGKLDLYRVFKPVLWPFEPIAFRIPCLFSVDGLDFGSCDYDFCEWFEDPLYACPFLTKANATCGCPFPSGTYEAYDFEVVLPPLDNQFLKLVALGTYRLKWHWVHPDGTQLGCLLLEGTLVN